MDTINFSSEALIAAYRIQAARSKTHADRSVWVTLILAEQARLGRKN